MRRPLTDQRGFTVIEVIIAVLIVAVIGAGSAMALGRAATSETQTERRTQQRVVAESALEHVTSNADWMSWPDCQSLTSRCDISQAVQGADWLTQKGRATNKTFAATVFARGIDAPADGLGPDDRDGTIPDYFIVDALIPDPDAPSDQNRVIRLSTTIDSVHRVAGGTISIRVCTVHIQADERVAIGDCPQDTLLDLPPPPDNGGHSTNRDWQPFQAAKAAGLTRMAVKPANNVNCTVTNPDGSAAEDLVGGAVPVSPTGANPNPVSGLWTSPPLKPGRYRVKCDVPPGSGSGLEYVPQFEYWSNKSQPPARIVNVEARRDTRATLLFRPKAVQNVAVKMATIRHQWYYDPQNASAIKPELIYARKDATVTIVRWDHPDIFKSLDYDGNDAPKKLQLVPSPYGRVPLAKASPPTTTGMSMGAWPGLYSNTVLADNEHVYLYTPVTGNPMVGMNVSFLHHNGGQPIDYFFVQADGTVQVSPSVTPGGLWAVRWYCFKDANWLDVGGSVNPVRSCPSGDTDIGGRGTMNLEGAGGHGSF